VPLRYLLLITLFACTCAPAPAQKAITVADMQAWKQIEDETISADGRYVLYTLKPDVGDVEAVLYDSQTRRETRFPRLSDARFNYPGTHLLGTLRPSRDTVLAYRRDEQDKELKKMDTLLVRSLSDGTERRYPEVYGVETAERNGELYAYTTASLLPDSLRKDMDKDARRLVVRRFAQSDSFYLEGVTDFRVARDEPVVVAQRSAKDSTWSDGVLLIDTRELKWRTLSEAPATYGGLAVSYGGDHVAFLSREQDEEATQPPFHLHYWSAGSDSAYLVTGRDMDWLPRGYRISDDRRPYFSEDGRYLFFGTTPRRPELDSTALASEQADVEVWSTREPVMYTEQNNRLPRDKKFTYLAVYRTGSDDFEQLAGPEYPETMQPAEGRGRHVLLYTEEPYVMQTMWEGGPAGRDAILVDLRTGERKEVMQGEPGFMRWSPEGKYISWYNPVDTAYRVYEVATDETHTLTTNAFGVFYDELNDRPMDPYPYGTAGWTENDESLIVYDRYDLWELDPTERAAPQRLTHGRDEGITYRYYDLNREDPAVDRNMLLITQRESDYQGGYALYRDGQTRQIATGPFTYGNFRKAREADRYVFTRESYTDFPDLRYTTELTDQGRVISEANPQQEEFGMGTAELFQWIDHEGRELRGLLIKPAGFDPAKQYPLMVNFYERSSDRLFRHRTPVPGRSSVNYPHYASRGYVIFNPDVIYREGYPGESAYNCVMSGVSSLLEEGYIDKTRIGLQGHSWGGYQAAYLATKTDLFAAIESGAPVVNMFAAYGGIRWGSGRSRQFQYERTQSRIGGSPWEYPLRYIENSPLFTSDKINTPILILHNDEDGAVPWYQGIEWFTALRRLGKPAWFLNYRGEPHWPLKAPNRADFQTRMAQFFDYYLLGEPMPRWMKEGVSPLERGIEQNLELTRE
jgi:dipeptidyl aminopeptidase/acylaminoacyl peptidase